MSAQARRLEWNLNGAIDICFLESYAKMAVLEKHVSLPQVAAQAGGTINDIPLHLRSDRAMARLVLDYAERRIDDLLSPSADPAGARDAVDTLKQDLVTLARDLPWTLLFALRPVETSAFHPGFATRRLVQHLEGLYAWQGDGGPVPGDVDPRLAARRMFDALRLMLFDYCMHGLPVGREVFGDEINLTRTIPSNHHKDRVPANIGGTYEAMGKVSERPEQTVPPLSVIRGGARVRDREEQDVTRVQSIQRRQPAQYEYRTRRRKQRLSIPRSTSIHPVILSLIVMATVSLLFMTLYLLR